MIDRRMLLVAALATAGCRGQDRVGEVYAAGGPAALLIWALAPDRLAGWPRRPTSEALAWLPERAARLPELGALTTGGRPASLEAVAAGRPTMIVDYGDVDVQHQAVARDAVRRLPVPYHLIDGALRRTPQAFEEAGRLLDVPERGRALAQWSSEVLSRWAARAGAGPTFYYARGRDGRETGVAGSLATEVLEGAGWSNVARGQGDIVTVSLEQAAAWDPEVIVTLNPAFAQTALRDTVWSQRRDGARRRILLLPDLPFGWIDRPPSVNRLLGCAWLASNGGSFAAEAARITDRLYGRRPAASQLSALEPQWLA